jgi:hypothetical protein
MNPNLPTLTRTKAEAIRLAYELFPPADELVARIMREKPEIKLPTYHASYETADTLRVVFDWLFDKHTRVYKRARWHLFYSMATNAVAALEKVVTSRVIEMMIENRTPTSHHANAAAIMRGEGEGV